MTLKTLACAALIVGATIADRDRAVAASPIEASSGVNARIKSRVFGSQASCYQAYLAPKSPAIDSLILGYFGNNDSGLVETFPQAPSDAAFTLADARTSRCLGNQVSFAKIEPGVYYLVVAVRTADRGLVGRGDGAIFMRRVEVTAQQKISLEL